MKAKIVFEGKWKLSKQNSYLAGRYGRRYKNPKYESEQQRMFCVAHPQILKQKWKCTTNQVAMKITFYGPKMPCDWDNCGLLTDTFQGSVVKNDNQFYPVTVDFKKQSDRKIIVELEKIQKRNEYV
jgi:Holliday junction resolvase RusA-like endonuclease